MTQITEYAPAIVEVYGKTATDRKMSVLTNATAQASLALVSAGGKVGKAAASRAATIGIAQVAHAASRGNYKPAAEYFAGRTGKPFVISSRSAFEALPDQFEAAIMQSKLAKNGGYVEDKKTGAMKPSATHKLALELKCAAVELVAMAAEYAAQRQAERADQQALTA